MPYSAVKSVESCKLSTENPSVLIYECSLAQIKGKIIYTFTSAGRLMRGKYFLAPEYVNINYYIRDFKLLQDLLIEKYGDANKKLTITSGSKLSISDDEWAAYLSSGTLRVEKKWSTDKTNITLTLSKVGDKPAIQIDYVSIQYDTLDIKDSKAVILKDL